MTYQPLNPVTEEIRLLFILPATSREAPLHCALKTVALQHVVPEWAMVVAQHPPAVLQWRHALPAWLDARRSPTETTSHVSSETSRQPQTPSEAQCRFAWGDFTTLSYVWGNAHDTEPILVDFAGHGGSAPATRPATRNLAEALRTFRQLGEFLLGTSTTGLWVDAVCINQDDPAEQASQVAMMRSIYARSWTTVTHLGPDKAGGSSGGRALALLRTLAEHHLRGTGGKLLDKLAVDPGLLGSDGPWLALQRLLERPYWSRVWIMQEVALAPAGMRMFAGHEFVTWLEVQHAIGAIHTVYWYVKNNCLAWDRRKEGAAVPEVDLGNWGAGAETLHHIWKDLVLMWHKMAARPGEEDEMWCHELLQAAAAARCFMPVDKVYGLLAVMPARVANLIRVDYKMSTADLSAQVGRLFLKDAGNLELCRLGSAWNATNTPSWAPDWTSDRDGRDLLQPVLGYRAGGGLPSIFSFHGQEGRHMTIRGVLVDAVDGMGPLSSVSLSQNEVATVNSTIQQPRSFRSAYGTPEETRHALARALVGNRKGLMRTERPGTSDSAPLSIFQLPRETDAAMAEFERRGWRELRLQGHRYRQWEAWQRANDALRLCPEKECKGPTLADFFSDTLNEPADDGNDKTMEAELWDAYNLFHNVVAGRRFVTTTEGRFGWVPENVKGEGGDQVRSGDRFFIAFGCSVPLLVRQPQDDVDVFQILGEGYLQGLMDGEIVDLLNTETYRATDVELC